MVKLAAWREGWHHLDKSYRIEHLYKAPAAVGVPTQSQIHNPFLSTDSPLLVSLNTLRAPLEQRKFFLFLRFSCVFELIPVNSYVNPVKFLCSKGAWLPQHQLAVRPPSMEGNVRGEYEKEWAFPFSSWINFLFICTVPKALRFIFRVAVVTGGNRGIGLEICRQLASKGVTVVLTARDQKRGADAVKTLGAHGLPNVVFHQLEVGDLSSAARLADFIREQYGKLDILVNNAGVIGASTEIRDPESFQKEVSYLACNFIIKPFKFHFQ